jgi:protein-disulfide isomerase
MLQPGTIAPDFELNSTPDQEALSWDDLFTYAQSAGLDMHRFEQDVQKESLTEKVESDFESGIRSGVNGTPSFYINGEKYEGSWEAIDLIENLKAYL